jgi:hypothetical protein
MKAYESAAEAFAMAARMQPENAQEHVILAEIYALIPSRVKDAVAEHQYLLQKDPYRVDSYRQLYKLYFDARDYDAAWCVSAALSFLKKADAEQQQFHQQYRTDGPIRPKARLTNERWVKDLFHPEEDYVVGKLFEAVTPALLRMKAQPDKTWQLKKKDLIPDLMNTTVAFARTFGFATQVLSLPLTPRLFVCPDRQGGLAYATTLPPASVCGSALLSGVNRSRSSSSSPSTSRTTAASTTSARCLPPRTSSSWCWRPRCRSPARICRTRTSRRWPSRSAPTCSRPTWSC